MGNKTIQENEDLFIKVQECIVKSGQFSWYWGRNKVDLISRAETRLLCAYIAWISVTELLNLSFFSQFASQFYIILHILLIMQTNWL